MMFLDIFIAALPPELLFEDLKFYATRENWQNNPEQAAIEALNRCCKFDAQDYITRYPEVVKMNMDPIQHFVKHGIGLKYTFKCIGDLSVNSSFVKIAYQYYNDGNYKKALGLYEELADKLGYNNFKLNIELCKKRLALKVNGENVDVVFICDEEYALPTGVAVHSLKLNRNVHHKYNIYILCHHVNENSKARFLSLNEESFKIEVRTINKKFESVDLVNHVSKAALLKFELPNIFPDIDKILYLDSDVIVFKDIAELFKIEFNDNYAAGVADRWAYYYCNQKFNHRLNIDHDHYFNSGVLLLNLKKMREDNISSQLLKFREGEKVQFMDQDAFNVVLGRKFKYISFLYNVIATVTRRMDFDDIKEFYSQFGALTDSDWEKNAYVYHYASPEKPWKGFDVELAGIWRGYYASSIFSDIMLETTGNDILSNHFCRKNFVKPKISVIIPVFNSIRRLTPCIKSILDQKDIEELEVICIDDGSTDDSVLVLKSLRKTDERIRIIEQPKSNAGIARNRGIEASIGEFITFVDSDDKLASGKSLALACSKMKEANLDIVLCRAKMMDWNGKLHSECGWCYVEKLFPPKSVFSKVELGPYLFYCCGGNPWGKVFRSSFIKNQKIQFLDLPRSEDFYFVQMALAKSKRISNLDAHLIYYRTIDNHFSLENTKDSNPLAFYHADSFFYKSMYTEGLQDVELAAKISSCNRLRYNLRSVSSYESFCEIYFAVQDFYQQIKVSRDIMNSLNLLQLHYDLENIMDKPPEKSFFNSRR